MKKAGTLLSIIFSGLAASGVAHAGFVALGPAISIGSLPSSLTVGDKVFTGFTVSTAGSTSGGLVSPTLTLTPGTFNGDYGFELNGPFDALSILGSPATAILNYAISYTVTSSGPLIEDAGASFTNSTQCVGTAVCSATVSASTAGPTTLFTINSPSTSTDVPLVSKVSSLTVTDQILLTATSTSLGVAKTELSNLDFFFSQVPEPSSYAIVLGLGLFAMLFFARRRART
jgi:hypothetical protein